jgi:hypothetical protein
MDYMMSSSLNISRDFFSAYEDEILTSINVADEIIESFYPYQTIIPFTYGSNIVDLTDSDRSNLYVGQYLTSSILPPDTWITDFYTEQNSEYDDDYGMVYDDPKYYMVLNNASTEDGEYGVTLSEREPRYTFDGVVQLSMKHKNVLEGFITSYAGMTCEAGGQWILQAGYYKTPEITINEEDILVDGGLMIQTHADKSDTFNCAKPTFVSPADFYAATEAPAITSSFYKEKDQGEEIWQTIELPYCTSPIQAQRHAKIALFDNRLDMMIQMTLNYGAVRCRVGDNILVNHSRYGWVEKPFKVLQMVIDYSKMQVKMTCKETSPLVYDWSATDEQVFTSVPRSFLPDPRFVSTPINISIAAGTDQLKMLQDGTIIPQATINWEITGSVNIVEIYGKALTASVWQPVVSIPSDQTTYTTQQVEQDVSWSFGFYSVNSFGVRSEFFTQSAYIYGKSTPPNPPVSFSLVPGVGYVEVRWQNPGDLDYDGTQVIATDGVFPYYVYTAAESCVITIPYGTLYDFSIYGMDTSGNTSSLVGPLTAGSTIDATSISINEPSISIPADATGSVPSWVPSGYSLVLYVNGVNKTYNATPTNDAWRITSVVESNCTRDVGVAYPQVGLSAMTDDAAYLTITYVYRDINGTDFTKVGRVSYSKAIAGTSGTSGTDGKNAISWRATENFHQASYDGYVSMSAVPYTTLSFYEGGTEMVFAGLDAAPAPGQWSILTGQSEESYTIYGTGWDYVDIAGYGGDENKFRPAFYAGTSQVDSPTKVSVYARVVDSNNVLTEHILYIPWYVVLEGMPGIDGASGSNAGPSYGLQSDTTAGVLRLIDSGSVIQSGSGFKTYGSNNTGIWIGMTEAGAVTFDVGSSASFIRFNESESKVSIKADEFRHSDNLIITTEADGPIETAMIKVDGNNGSSVTIAGTDYYIGAGSSYIINKEPLIDQWAEMRAGEIKVGVMSGSSLLSAITLRALSTSSAILQTGGIIRPALLYVTAS